MCWRQGKDVNQENGTRIQYQELLLPQSNHKSAAFATCSDHKTKNCSITANYPQVLILAVRNVTEG